MEKQRARRKTGSCILAALLMVAACTLPFADTRGGAAAENKVPAERMIRFAYVTAPMQGEYGAQEKMALSGAVESAAPIQDVYRPYYGAAVRMWSALEQLWYGRQFSAVELAGLTLTESSGSHLYLDAQGKTVLADAAHYSWANGTYVDGSPLAPCDGGQLLTLTAAKSGILRCGLWMPSEEEFGWDAQDITLRVYEYDIGYNYDENGEPQQSYRCLRAWFVMDGTEFEIVGEAVDKAVFEACVRQVMWGAEE